jgi:hypothetical protein
MDTVSWFKTSTQNNGNVSTSVKYVSRKCKIWHEMTAAAVCGIPQIHAESCGSWTILPFLKEVCGTYCTSLFMR